MKSNASELMERMTREIFNQLDADARVKAIRELLSPRIRYSTPDGEVKGRTAIAAKVTHLLSGGNPPYRFTSLAPIQSAGDMALHRWARGAPDHEPVETGTDVIVVTVNQISYIYTLID